MGRIYGLHHIGLTVPDMEEAVRFFTEAFGAETIMDCGSVDADDAFMETHLGVTEGRKIVAQRVLQVGKGGSLELFQYSGNGGTPIKNNAEVGAAHIAFEVEDAYETAETLRKMGVDLLAGPSLIDGGPMKNLVWLYLRAPWGQYLEILSSNAPLGYEADGGPKLWTPKADT